MEIVVVSPQWIEATIGSGTWGPEVQSEMQNKDWNALSRVRDAS